MSFRTVRKLVCLALGAALASPVSAQPKGAGPAHALAMHGDVKYKAGFQHFDYADPKALKGGEVRLAALGSFDSLNGFILKGNPAAGLGLVYDRLTAASEDEPFTRYGLLAETIETPADRSWVVFVLRKEARFHDGSPVTPDDVIFTFETLRAKGHPQTRSYYEGVEKAEKVGERGVKFTFKPGINRELPLIVGEMVVLPRAYWGKREFDKTTLDAPLGGGPYRIESVDPGKSITYVRVKDYWGAKLPVNLGRNNLDRIRYDYYRDSTVALEALKGGAYDFRLENSAKNWATAYDVPAVKEKILRKEEVSNQNPNGMQGFVFNTRRPLFQDRRVREALSYAFDFEWSNKNLFYGAYTRSTSYFSNSELAASGLPGPDELAVLKPFRGRIPEEVFTRAFEPPKTDGSGNLRENLRRATELLQQAGWTVRSNRLVNAKTGAPFEFEILLEDPVWERIALPFARNLEKLGIKASVRTLIDSSQFEKRAEDFDFDMIVYVFGQSLSPGNEQRDYWASAKAAVPGSSNLAGVRDSVVDELVELVVAAPDRKSLVTRTRALDRVLLSGHYVIPHWHIRVWRLAYWDRFGRPKLEPKYMPPAFPDTWWVDPARDAVLTGKRAGGKR